MSLLRDLLDLRHPITEMTLELRRIADIGERWALASGLPPLSAIRNLPKSAAPVAPAVEPRTDEEIALAEYELEMFGEEHNPDEQQ